MRPLLPVSYCLLLSLLAAALQAPAYAQDEVSPSQLFGVTLELEETKRQNATLKEELVTLRKAMAELKSSPFAVKDKQATVKVFILKHVPPGIVARHLEDVFDPEVVRFAVDNDRRVLLAVAAEPIQAQILAIVTQLDIPTEAEPIQYPIEGESLAKPCLLRIFWLSNGPSYPDAPHAREFLPDTLVGALGELGVKEPFVVLQTSTSIEVHDDHARFEINDVPARLFGSRVLFHAEGSMIEVSESKMQLEIRAGSNRTVVRTEFGGGGFGDRGRRQLREYIGENHISGSMVFPLEHYMILGTSNYTTPDDANNSISSSFAYVIQVVENRQFAPSSN